MDTDGQVAQQGINLLGNLPYNYDVVQILSYYKLNYMYFFK